MIIEQIKDEFNSTRKSTKHCIIDKCSNNAILWSGHLIKGNGYVMAGFCETHRYTDSHPASDRKGCMGTLTEVGIANDLKSK